LSSLVCFSCLSCASSDAKFLGLLRDAFSEVSRFLFEIFFFCVVVLVEPGFELADSLECGGLLALGELAGVLLVLDLGLETLNRLLERVLGVDAFLGEPVLLCLHFGLLDHAVDFVLREAALLVLDGHVLTLAGGFVFGCDRHDAVGVDLEFHFDLRLAARRARDAVEAEVAEEVVVVDHGALALEDADVDRSLVVGRSRKDLRLFGRNGGAAGDKRCHDSTDSFDAQGQGCHVQQQDVAQLFVVVAAEDPGLHSCALCDCFVRIDTLVRFLAVEEVFDELLDFRDTSRTADEHDFVYGRLLELGLVEDVLDGFEGLLEEVGIHLFEGGTCHSLGQVLAAEECFDLDFDLLRGGKLLLDLLTLAAQLGDRFLVARRVEAVLLFELVDELRG